MARSTLKLLVLVVGLLFTWPPTVRAQSNLNCNDLLLAPSEYVASEVLARFGETDELENILRQNPSLLQRTNSESLSDTVSLLRQNGLSADQVKEMFELSPNSFSQLNTEKLAPYFAILSPHFTRDEIAKWIMTVGVSGLQFVTKQLSVNLAALEAQLGARKFTSWLESQGSELKGLNSGSVEELLAAVTKYLSKDEATDLILKNTSLIKYSSNLNKVFGVFDKFGWQDRVPEYLTSFFADLLRLKPQLLNEFLTDLEQNYPREAQSYLLARNIPVLSRAQAILRTSSLLEKLAPLASLSLDEQIVSGWSAVTIAVYRGELDTLEYLIRAGADVNMRDRDGNTALIWLARRSFVFDEAVTTQILNALISAGADLNSQNDLGTTALNWAKLWGENPSRDELKRKLTALGALR